MGHFCDGRVSAVIGTHSHVPTADGRILAKGTAYMTDVGMCGDYDSVIGMRKEAAVQRFVRKMPSERLEVAEGAASLCAASSRPTTPAGSRATSRLCASAVSSRRLGRTGPAPTRSAPEPSSFGAPCRPGHPRGHAARLVGRLAAGADQCRDHAPRARPRLCRGARRGARCRLGRCALGGGDGARRGAPPFGRGSARGARHPQHRAAPGLGLGLSQERLAWPACAARPSARGGGAARLRQGRLCAWALPWR